MAVRGTPPLVPPAIFARYPFLPGAEAVLEGLGVTLGELLSDPAYAPVRDLGRQRVERGSLDPGQSEAGLSLPRGQGEEQVLSFLYARLLVSWPEEPVLARRWCVAEAKGAWGRLQATGPDPGELVLVADRLGFDLKVPSGEKGGLVSFSLPDYVHLAAPIREADFRLIHQKVYRGRVQVDIGRAARLLQEGFRLRLLELVPVRLEPQLREALGRSEGDFLAQVLARLPRPSSRPRSGNLDVRALPPCMRAMMEMLQRGENLSHFGRFSLAAFLHTVGADPEFIVDCYRGAPDFDESITRYQVEHITRREGGKGYAPPECSTLVSNGLCFKEKDDSRPSICQDPSLRRPLDYYYRRLRAPPEGPEVAGRTPSPTEPKSTSPSRRP